jgi:hypothetical protein
MALTRNFVAASGRPNEINIVFDQPLNFNNSLDEIIITRTVSHFPVELENTTYPNSVTDTRPVEIYRASVIHGTSTATAAGQLTDSAATFSTLPKLTGRLLRDANSRVYKILDNTSTVITLDTTDIPAAGVYVILADFPQTTQVQQNFETDIRTEVAPGYIKNLVKIQTGDLILAEFKEDSLANLIHQDGAGVKRVIRSNTRDTIFFFDEVTTPVLGAGTFILNNFSGDTQPLPYLDNFLTEQEATDRSGSGLRDNRYYYYTAFNKPVGTNVAQAKFGSIDSGVSTQASAISVKNRNMGKLLYSYWPGIYRDLDNTEDLKDLMEVFGFHFEQLHALVESYRLQDTDNVFVNALPALADQTGLPSVGFSIGADTLRRIARDMIPCWKIKGSKEGIGIFIRKITTWDITNGTGDYAGAILDFLPNVEALRFFDPNLGSTNTRLTQTAPTVVTGGRFAQGLPGIVIPGFFTFREFVVTLPNVALLIASSEAIEVVDGNTVITDSNTNFGAPNSLVGNFLIPNEAEVNDIFEIVSNTTNTVTIKGVINNRNPGGKVVILSPLNKNRFIILNTLLPVYVPFGTQAGFTFVNV